MMDPLYILFFKKKKFQKNEIKPQIDRTKNV